MKEKTPHKISISLFALAAKEEEAKQVGKVNQKSRNIFSASNDALHADEKECVKGNFMEVIKSQIPCERFRNIHSIY